MPVDTVSILDGNEFVVSDRQGDLEATPTENHGLFLNDTRFLSRWVLTVNGLRPKLLSVDDLAYFKVQFFAALATGTVYVDSHLSVVRQRAVGQGFSEDITLANHSREPMDLEVRLEAAADFADLFEVKDKLEKKGELYRRVADDKLVIGYRRERFERQTVISADRPAEIREDGFLFRVRLEPHAQWTARVEVAIVLRPGGGDGPATKSVRERGEQRADDLGMSVQDWVAAAPKLTSSSAPLELTYKRCLVDLAALRFRTEIFPGALPAAGLPWFMAVFGRDSLITSFGTVWPHDNSIIAWGLRRYGYRAEAARISWAMLEAAELFHHRLPEAFAGYPRKATKYPVEYPTACSPQAWATGAPLLFVRALLGLESDGQHLIVDPALPEALRRLELIDIPGRWDRMDAFGRAREQMRAKRTRPP